MPLINEHLAVIKSIKYEQSLICVEMPYLQQFNVSYNNPLNLVSNILLPICDGIKFIHSHGIIHGSIKPNNLFMDESGFVLISDVWHRFLYPQNICHMSLNNLYYSSPEIIESNEITKSSDIYSLGEIIYYCFNNCRDVIHSNNIIDLYKDVHNFKWKIDYNKIPSLFRETLMKMLNINPTDRPSIDEVYNQLKKILLENCINYIKDENEKYIDDENWYEKLGCYFLNDNDSFVQLIDRINNSESLKQSYINVLMNIALKDRDKRMYMLKHLKYDVNTKEYFKMIKLISNNNEIEIDIDNYNTPFSYSPFYKNNVNSLTIRQSKQNIMIKSYYQLLQLLYPFTNLRKLTICNIKLNNQIEKIFYSILSRNSQLVDLKCVDLCLIGVKLNYIKYSTYFFTNLKKLSLSSDKISDEVVDSMVLYITALHNLKELNMSHNNIKALLNLPPNFFDLSSSSFSSSSYSGTTSSHSFTATSTPSNVQSLSNSIESRKNLIQSELVHPIFSLNHLEKLDLGYNQIDDVCLPKLFKIIPTYSLKSINLSANSFCDVGFVSFCSLLSKIPRLEDLSFDSNKLSDSSMNYFATHLSNVRNLKYLKIGSFLFFRSPIGDGSIDKFSCYLSCIPKLEELTITDTDMTDDGFFSISEQFSCITNLQKLSISCILYSFIYFFKIVHKSTPLMFKEICSSLYNFQNLKQLDFSWNELGLESLILNENCIKDIGMKALSKNIRFLTDLKELYLSRNSIEDDGILDLSKQFSSIQQLKILDLSINMISDKGIMYISQYSSYLTKLECLFLAFNRKLTVSSNNDFVKIINQLENIERLNGAVDLPEDISIRLKEKSFIFMFN